MKLTWTVRHLQQLCQGCLCLSATIHYGMVSSNQVYPAQTLTYGNIFLLLIHFLCVSFILWT